MEKVELAIQEIWQVTRPMIQKNKKKYKLQTLDFQNASRRMTRVEGTKNEQNLEKKQQEDTSESSQ